MPSPIPNFDAIAPVYDALAQLVFGKAQRRAQASFLNLIPAGASVLILGGGSGWILQELFTKGKPGHVLYLEPSGKMLAQAKENLKATGFTSLVEFRKGTEQHLTPEEKFDVVLTPFVLDLFTEPEVKIMVQNLDEALLPGGLWVHTDFHLFSSSRLKKAWQQPLLWAMYRFFRRVSGISASTLTESNPYFEELTYQMRQEALFYGSFIKTQVWQKSNGPEHSKS
ncbi:class I SAM-dependent methyltransferase [Rufibacter sp. LB8]|uniref:class I SAM-dependent methyltransferase n=1 Tax=Rufibacter sp. LB8 TaxID=2777781 RepID=UPI00178C691C|nr:class I SAM-dependent methyltransferase [Rufibacter sp. LB8]